MTVQSRIVLEPSAQAILDATSTPPLVYELEPSEARKVLDDLQAAPTRSGSRSRPASGTRACA